MGGGGGDLSDVERGDLLHGQQLVFHITLAPGLNPRETFQGTDPWPLMTDGCHG